MLRERVSNDIYVFTSELYAQVTAGAIVTGEGVVLVDSLPFPIESRDMAAFIGETSRAGVRYLILTHYHADHTYGAYLYPQADVVAHATCRELLAEVAAPALETAKAEEPELEDVIIRLPDVTFDEGEIALQVAERVIRLIHAPGHTRDSIMVYVEDDRVLFAADTVMPVPSIVDGDVEAFRRSLQKVKELSVENLVQGHGEVILRGEVKEVAQNGLDYLDCAEKVVSEAIKNGEDRRKLREHSIEACGLSRIPLNGQVQHIHTANLLYLYDQMTS